MIFREMEKQDLDAIVSLETKCFQENWKVSQCLYELEENPFSHGWVVIRDEKIVAYAFLWETFEMAQLARIGVDPMYRKQGIATFLMRALCKRAKESGCEFMTLEVRESNESAIGLYQNFEFVCVNISKGYYSDGENAVVMTKAL